MSVDEISASIRRGMKASLVLYDRLCTYVNLSILEALLQIVVDSFIGYFTNEGEIGNANFLLLCRVECRLLDIRFAATRCPASTTRLCIAGGFVALRSPTNTLYFAKSKLSSPYSSPGLQLSAYHLKVSPGAL